ncbi:hypothetical protein [Rhodococcus sp. NPDC003348]
MNYLVEHRTAKTTGTEEFLIPEQCAPDGARKLDVIWLRRSLGICGYLERVHSLSSSDRPLVTFAIMWAPYGGSRPEDLLVTFGVHRAEFHSLLAAALAPKNAEDPQARNLKKLLHDDLVRAWNAHGCAH